MLSAAVMLAGCQSNPKPPPLDAASAAASPTPSESNEAAPTLPAEAKGTSEASAKAFVRHYIDSVNYAMRTGQTSELRGLSTTECSTCEAIAERIDEVYGEGGRLEGEGWKVLSLSAVGAVSARSAKIAAGIEMSPQTAYGSDKQPSQSATSRGNLDFSLGRDSEGWTVARLEATH